MSTDSNRLGERLVKSGRLTEDQLKEALDLQESIGGRLGTILIKLGLIKSSQLAEVLSIMCQVPLVKMDDIFIDHKLIKIFERDLMDTRQFVPISATDNTIKIATADPSDMDILNLVEFETEKSVEINAMSLKEIQKILSMVFVKKSASKEKKVVANKEAGIKNKAKSQIRNSSFRDVLLALIDDLNAKGIVEYSEILSRMEQRQNEDE